MTCSKTYKTPAFLNYFRYEKSKVKSSQRTFDFCFPKVRYEFFTFGFNFCCWPVFHVWPLTFDCCLVHHGVQRYPGSNPGCLIPACVLSRPHSVLPASINRMADSKLAGGAVSKGTPPPAPKPSSRKTPGAKLASVDPTREELEKANATIAAVTAAHCNRHGTKRHVSIAVSVLGPSFQVFQKIFQTFSKSKSLFLGRFEGLGGMGACGNHWK